MSGVRIENLAALDRANERIALLSKIGAQIRQRAKGTLRRRLGPEAKRQITAKFNIKPAYAVKRLRTFFDDSGVELVALAARTYLSNFGPVQNSTGIYVEIEKGAMLNLPHAFMRSPGGYNSGTGQKTGTAFCRMAVLSQCLSGGGGWIEATDIVESSTGGHRNKRVAVDNHGYPIAVLLGPTVAQMMAAGNIEDNLVDFASKLFGTEIDRLIEATNGQ